MKKLGNVLVLLLALNFLAVAGGVGWLYQQGKLDRERVMAIKDLLFAQAAPTTQETPPTTAPATQPILQLEELLAKQAGRTAGEQVEFIQQTFDAQMAQLDRRQREVKSLEDQVELAKRKLAQDRSALAQERQQLEAEKKEAQRLAVDEGFQDSLQLYERMPAKQVKEIFMTLEDQTIIQYLRSMDSRAAARIVKEFKQPDEVERIQGVLEKMRQAQASTKE